jgi:hypothetical protein
MSMGFEELREAQWNYGGKGGAKRSPAAAHYLTCITPGAPVPAKWNPTPRKPRAKQATKQPTRPRPVTQPVVINLPGLRISIAA